MKRITLEDSTPCRSLDCPSRTWNFVALGHAFRSVLGPDETSVHE